MINLSIWNITKYSLNDIDDELDNNNIISI